jgi:acetyl esterase/lipase
MIYHPPFNHRSKITMRKTGIGLLSFFIPLSFFPSFFGTPRYTCILVFLGTLGLLAAPSSSFAQEMTLDVWPSTPPGRIAAKGAEADTSNEKSGKVAGRSVIRTGNVSKPTIAVYPAPSENNTGAAVLVCPGGGYHILAYDLEGTEVCEWLNSIGVTGIVLKYRVPRTGDGHPIEPLQDAQRAMSLVREHASEWKIDPAKIGVLGFSAGGHLAARLSTSYEQRTYELIDAVDKLSCRPDFSLLIYPAYLFSKDSEDLIAADLPIHAQMPPAFVTMALDDPVDSENVLRLALAMKRAKASVEMHLYPTGGHGYGLRPTDQAATTWPARATEWLSTITK